MTPGVEKAVAALKEAAAANYWGTLSFTMKNGNVVLIRREQTEIVRNGGTDDRAESKEVRG